MGSVGMKRALDVKPVVDGPMMDDGPSERRWLQPPSGVVIRGRSLAQKG
jgi:hypothetical protein